MPAVKAMRSAPGKLTPAERRMEVARISDHVGGKEAVEKNGLCQGGMARDPYRWYT